MNPSICVIIGDPVAHSLSPKIHNAGYLVDKLPFVMVAARVGADDLKAAMGGMRAMGVRGISVTMPHKQSIIPFLDELDSTAEEIGAVNTVVNRDGILTGYNTDWIGIIKPLEKMTALNGKTVAVLGAGGAARAAICACLRQGADVTVYNRTISRTDDLRSRWKCSTSELSNYENISKADIIINTTSVGMGDKSDESPVPTSALRPGQIIFETIYSPDSTRLIKDAATIGARVIRGAEMFLEQAVAQFELQTGSAAPRETMAEALQSTLMGR